MLQAHDYTTAFDRTLAWGLYLGCGVLVLLILIWLTRRWQRDIRLLLLALLAVAMFLPAPIPGHAAMAPAIIFVALGLLTGGIDILAPVLVRFSLVGILVVVLVIIESIWWRARRRRKTAPTKAAGTRQKTVRREPTLR